MKTLIKSIARKFGIEISRYNLLKSDMAKIQHLLSYNKIDLVLDIGANTGQFARYIRSGGYKGEIISFEPLSSAYHELKRLSKKDPLWTVAPRTAIGNKNGEIDINISKNSYSSSILEMLETHLNGEPDSIYIGSERVRISKLDTIAVPYVKRKNSIYLKIDTQGYEEFVLDGANQILPKVRCLQVELSLIPLYEGQLLFMEMIERIYNLGYEMYNIIPGFTDVKTGRLLQVDGIFFMRL